jgi:hypothetical protein
MADLAGQDLADCIALMTDYCSNVGLHDRRQGSLEWEVLMTALIAKLQAEGWTLVPASISLVKQPETS